jgi:hypothetical protein
MKISQLAARIILLFSAAFCIETGAQNSPTFSTNIFLLGPNDVRDETGSEQSFYVRRTLRHEILSETLPANLDTNGNWGMATNGLQLSLRFRKKGICGWRDAACRRNSQEFGIKPSNPTFCQFIILFFNFYGKSRNQCLAFETS